MGLNWIARPLLASIFISGGLGQLRTPGGRAVPVKKALNSLAIDLGDNGADMLVKVNGGVMVGAGAALAVGIFPKCAALALIGSLAPTTAIGHPFWAQSDAKAKNMHLTQFLKNAAIVGGLLSVIAAPKKQGRCCLRKRDAAA